MGDEKTTTVTKRAACGIVALVMSVLLMAQSAEASLVSGLQHLVAGIFSIPVSALVGTFTGPPVIGTVFGAINGTFQTVGLVTTGALEVLGAAIPLAKAAAPFVLPFVF